jgi:hypothetical protein
MCESDPLSKVDRELGDEVLAKNLYRQTGAPVHAAYALTQLHILYVDPNLAQEVCQSNLLQRWQTITSVCLLI